MKIQKNDSQRNLLEVRNLITTVEKKLSTFGDKKVIIEKLEPSELEDLYKILTMCELLLSKYESRKFTYQNMKKFVDILDSTIESLEMMNGKIDELTISADFAMKKIKEFESEFLHSKTDS